MSKKLLLLGGGGHCKSVLDTVLSLAEYQEIGIIDKKEKLGERILSIPVIGCDEDLPKLYNEGYHHAFITVGSIGDARLRIKLYDQLKKIGYEIPNIIDKTSIVSDNTRLMDGIFVGKNAVINIGSIIKRGAIINSSAVIEHDCIVDEFTHVAPGAVLCGEVHIQMNTHIGANSVVKQKVKIGSDTMIGAGSNVIKDIGSEKIAYGNPCREVNSG